MLFACIMHKGSKKSEYPQVDLFCQELCFCEKKRKEIILMDKPLGEKKRHYR